MANNTNVAFELKLLVIAILIPLFFQIFPQLAKGIAFYPFKFLLPQLSAYLVGAVWFLVLLSGLFNLTSHVKDVERGKKYYFQRTFDLALYTTVGTLLFIMIAYTVALAETLLKVNLQISMFVVSAVVVVLTIYADYRGWFK